MPLRRQLCLALLTGLLLSAAPAYADDPEPEVSDSDPTADDGDVWDSLLQLSITLGLDTPFGVAGGAIEFTPYRYITIYAGGGVARFGGRVAGGLRLNFPIGNAAVGMMLGAGGGSQEWDSTLPGVGATQPDSFTITRRWDFAFDVHAGITFEYRWDMGLFGRIGFGATGIIESDADTCTIRPEGADASTGTDCLSAARDLASPIWGWAGLTIGYALDL